MSDYLTTVIEAMTVPFTVMARPMSTTASAQTAFDQACTAIHSWLARVERRFSAFRDDSAVADAKRGDWHAMLDDPDFAEVYARCVLAQRITGGAFDALRTSKTTGHPDYDPTGLVKGWAIDRAFDRYLAPLTAGPNPLFEAAALNGGGDIRCHVTGNSQFTWGVGIERPDRPDAIHTVLRLTDGALATSGTTKRGEHIHRTHADNQPAIIQASVVASTLADADIWATAAVSAGRRRFTELAKRNGLTATLVDDQLNITRLNPESSDNVPVPLPTL